MIKPVLKISCWISLKVFWFSLAGFWKRRQTCKEDKATFGFTSLSVKEYWNIGSLDKNTRILENKFLRPFEK